MENLTSIWDFLLEELKERTSSPLFDYYILPSEPISISKDKLVIKVPDIAQKTVWENNLFKLATEILNQKLPDATIIVHTDADFDFELLSPQQSTETIDSIGKDANLNPNLTFENFIVGESNKFAHAAAHGVAYNLGLVYNPLFFYGGSGLGKTHLMHAIGNEAIKENPNIIVKYVTSETFTNEFTASIRMGSIERFKEIYRNVDLLLIDDIQFFADKERTLDEFFHTFNALQSANKQIVLSSDRLASDIPELPDRLVSRFGSGLSIDVQPPDLETRAAILKQVAIDNHIDIEDDTIVYIAGQVNSNIRELKAALTKINFFALTNRQKITVDLAAKALVDSTISNGKRIITIKDIISEVTQLYDVTFEQIIGKNRKKEIVEPRQVAMYLSRELTDVSLPKIGQEFGGKDHTTVMHAYEKISKAIENNNQTIIVKINAVKKKLT